MFARFFSPVRSDGAFVVTPDLKQCNISLPHPHEIDAIAGSPYGGVRATSAFSQSFLYAYTMHGGVQVTPVAALLHLQKVVAMFFADPARAESVRTRFVKHKGKMKLSVVVDEVDWSEIANQLVELVAKNSDDSLRGALSPAELSGCTPMDITVSNMAHLATMKEFFGYHMSIACGLSHVDVTGTAEDWDRVLMACDATRQLLPELKEWVEWYCDIVQLFLDTNKAQRMGKRPQSLVTKWSEMVSDPDYGCGGPVHFKGWLKDMDPFTSTGAYVFGKRTTFTEYGMSHGWCSFPLVVNICGAEHEVEVRAGFIALELTGRTFKAVSGYEMVIPERKEVPEEYDADDFRDEVRAEMTAKYGAETVQKFTDEMNASWPFGAAKRNTELNRYMGEVNVIWKRIEAQKRSEYDAKQKELDDAREREVGFWKHT